MTTPSGDGPPSGPDMPQNGCPPGHPACAQRVEKWHRRSVCEDRRREDDSGSRFGREARGCTSSRPGGKLLDSMVDRPMHQLHQHFSPSTLRRRAAPGTSPCRRTSSGTAPSTARTNGRSSGSRRAGVAFWQYPLRAGDRTEATVTEDQPVGRRAGPRPPCAAALSATPGRWFSRAGDGAPGRTAPPRRRRRQAGRPGCGW